MRDLSVHDLECTLFCHELKLLKYQRHKFISSLAPKFIFCYNDRKEDRWVFSAYTVNKSDEHATMAAIDILKTHSQ